MTRRISYKNTLEVAASNEQESVENEGEDFFCYISHIALFDFVTSAHVLF